MTPEKDRDQLIADLRDQVEALEEIVKRRSDELRLIQELACEQDRLMIASIFDGDIGRERLFASIDEYYSMAWLPESTHFLPSSVEASLAEAWHDAPKRPPVTGESS